MPAPRQSRRCRALAAAVLAVVTAPAVVCIGRTPAEVCVMARITREGTTTTATLCEPLLDEWPTRCVWDSEEPPTVKVEVTVCVPDPPVRRNPQDQ